MLVAGRRVAYLLDLVSKLSWSRSWSTTRRSRSIGDWLRLEVIRNRGAAFGIGEALTIIFTVIAAAVIVVIARLARKLYSLPWAIALGLLLGGAFGNLTDRIFRAPGVFEGAVVDFIAPGALRGLQPRRLGDRLRRHPDRAAVLPGPGPGRHASTRTDSGRAGRTRAGVGPTGAP